MKIKVVAAVAFGSFMLLLHGSSGVVNPTTHPVDLVEAIQWGKTVGGCRASVVIPKSELVSGEAVDLLIRVENVGKETITIWEPKDRSLDVFDIEVTDSSGKKTARTSYANRKIKVRSGGRATILRPGEKAEKSLRLNTMVDLTCPAVYSVLIGLNLSQADPSQIVTAPEFTITIEEYQPPITELLGTDHQRIKRG